VSSLARCCAVSSRSAAARLSSSCATEEAPTSGMIGTCAPEKKVEHYRFLIEQGLDCDAP
jgi:hypothetical protein